MKKLHARISIDAGNTLPDRIVQERMKTNDKPKGSPSDVSWRTSSRVVLAMLDSGHFSDACDPRRVDVMVNKTLKKSLNSFSCNVGR